MAAPIQEKATPFALMYVTYGFWHIDSIYALRRNLSAHVAATAGTKYTNCLTALLGTSCN